MKSNTVEIIKCVVIAVILSLIIGIFIRPIIVRGESMYPTFKDGDYAITYRKANIQRNDVIVFRTEGRYLIKRVIGMPGDNIDEEGNVVSDTDKYILTVGENEYYVLGDNRENSHDSRDFGCIEKDVVVGKVEARLFPNPSTSFENKNIDIKY